MSTLAEPVPERLTADAVNARWAAGAERAAALEPRLVRQYEASLRATARRCVAAYRARTQVLTAAFDPSKHPHRPGGNAKGGEWAPTFSSEFISPSGEQAGSLSGEVADWPGETEEQLRQREAALQALVHAQGSGILQVLRKNGELVGLTGYLYVTTGPGYRAYHVNWAAATGGNGVRLFNDFIDKAAADGVAVEFKGTAASARLYRTLGLEEHEGEYFLSPADVEKLSKEGLAFAREARKRRALTAAMPPKPRGDPTSISQPPQPTVDQVLNAELAAASAEARTQTTRRRMAAAVAGDILGSFEPDEGTRALLEPLVRRQAGVQAERLVAGSRGAVANVILDALVEGWSVETTADYMLKVLNEQARWRAVMLARTDLIALGNGAADASVRVLGDAGPQYKTWLTAGDERVRETHVDADRQTVGAQQPFSVGSSLLQYPGDPAGGDEETINCRCTQIFTDSPQPVLRHTFEGGIREPALTAAVLASALSADELEALTAAFDPAKHPHRPAGDARGGEWAATTEYAVTSNGEGTREERGVVSEGLFAEAQAFPDKNGAKSLAQEVANDAYSEGVKVHTLRSNDGILLSLASTRENLGSLQVMGLASKGGGSGAALLRRITEDAHAAGKSAELKPRVGLKAYYERLGFVEEGGAYVSRADPTAPAANLSA